MSLNEILRLLEGIICDEFYKSYKYNGGSFTIINKGNKEEGNDKLFFKIWRSLVLRNLILNFNIQFRKELKIYNNREYRKTKLTIALKKYQIEFRPESNLCRRYIGKNEKGVDNIVQILCCYKYWFEICNAKHGLHYSRYKSMYPIPLSWPWMKNEKN